MAGIAVGHPQAALINAVVAVMGAPVHPPSVSLAVAAHPYSAAEHWDYTRTWQVVVAHGGANHNVRGHVHYRRQRLPGGGFAVPANYIAGPGRYWISGVAGWDAATPAWMVARYNAITLAERTAGTNHFNVQHPVANPAAALPII